MTRSRARWWRILAVLAALGLLAAACGDDSGDDDSADTTETTAASTDTTEQAMMTPEYGGEIVVGLEAETNNWTPGPAQWANSGYSVSYTFYDPYMSLDSEGEFKPFLAESLEPNDDLTEWTMTMRDGVQYHDGTPLDADSVVWNMETLHFNPDSQSYGTLVSAGMTGIEKVDDMTVKFTLEEPNAAFPDLLRGEIGMPISQTAYEADPEGFTNSPVGTGPFMFESWTRDAELVVVRNPDYWWSDADGNQLPFLDKITFRPITQEESRVASLQSGDVQMMQTLRGTNVKQVLALVDEGGYEDSFFVGNTSGSAILNVLEPPLDDVRIRQALAYAGDSYQVQEVLGDDGLTEPSTGFFSEDSPWYSETAAEAYPGFNGRDVDAASALVEEYRADPNRSDGKSPGDDINIEYNCPPDPSLIQVSQLQQALWQEVGFVVGLNQVEQADHITNAVGSADTQPPYRGDYIINCWRAGGGDGDPLTALQSFFGPVETTPGNFTNFTDPGIDEALVTLRTSADFATRYDAVEQIGIISGEQVPILWSSPTPTVVGYVDTIHGVSDWTLPDGEMGTGTPGSVMRFHMVFMEQ